MLRDRCKARQQAVLRGESDTIADCLGLDREASVDLPAVPCRWSSTVFAGPDPAGSPSDMTPVRVDRR